MLLKRIIQNILQVSTWKDIFLVGLSWLDASGKSYLGKEIYKEIDKLWKNVYYISGDSFHFDMNISNTLVEENWAKQHMNYSINFEKLRNDFLLPLIRRQ